MEKEFVPWKESIFLENIGFDEKCFAIYATFSTANQKYYTFPVLKLVRQSSEFTKKGVTKAPTFSHAFRWFREKHKLNCEQNYLPNVDKYGTVVSDMTIKPKNLSKSENLKRGSDVTNNFARYYSHEEAELECLRQMIKIVKERM